VRECRLMPKGFASHLPPSGSGLLVSHRRCRDVPVEELPSSPREHVARVPRTADRRRRTWARVDAEFHTEKWAPSAVMTASVIRFRRGSWRTEVTRTGMPIRTGRFMAARVGASCNTLLRLRSSPAAADHPAIRRACSRRGPLDQQPANTRDRVTRVTSGSQRGTACQIMALRPGATANYQIRHTRRSRLRCSRQQDRVRRWWGCSHE
jgi:hypothetical protein